MMPWALIHLMPFLHKSLVLVHIGFSRHAPRGVHHFSPFWYRCFYHQKASLKGSQQSTKTRVFLLSTKPHLLSFNSNRSCFLLMFMEEQNPSFSFLYLMTHWLHDLNLGILFLEQYFSYFATLSLFFFLSPHGSIQRRFLNSSELSQFFNMKGFGPFWPHFPLSLCKGFGSLRYSLTLIPKVVLQKTLCGNFFKNSL